MSELLQVKDTKYNLRNILVYKKVKTVSYGKESISYFTPFIWNQIPDEIKNSKSLNSFKSKMKRWIPAKCPCTLCKTKCRLYLIYMYCYYFMISLFIYFVNIYIKVFLLYLHFFNLIDNKYYYYYYYYYY